MRFYGSTGFYEHQYLKHFQITSAELHMPDSPQAVLDIATMIDMYVAKAYMVYSQFKTGGDDALS